MRTFEEYLIYQGWNIATMDEEALKTWRDLYEEACEMQRQRQFLTPNVRANSNEFLYAVAVRDDPYLWLVLWVKRSVKGDYYVFLPLNDSDWDPHTSYHRDGRFHHKSYDQKLITSQKQLPNAGFRGTEQMLIRPFELEMIRAAKVLCDPSQFTGVFEIPGDPMRQRGCGVAIDLTEMNGPPLASPRAEIIKQMRFSHAVPEVLLTLWRQELGE
ncbi:MAG: hypothetical protein HYZ50_26020 [Deltaproteobacteria bacterium]|nr:hypothetical protein [Deltaproteobacteria bacterium]